MVFQHLRAPDKVFNPEEPREKPTFDSYKPLVHAMMVCHKWHVVGSEMASLWTDVDYSRDEDRPFCLLKRSGMTPIHLRLDVSVLGEDHTYLHEMVGANAFRLRQLDVSMSDTDTMSAVMQLLGNDMPVLRCLKMWHGSHRGNSVLRNVQGRFPSLRGMALINHLWLPAPDVGPLTMLTHLYVSGMSSGTPIATFTMLLDAIPTLEVLDLHGCYFGVTLAELPTRPTTLQRLTHLTVRLMSTGTVEVLMSFLVLPRATTVYLWLTSVTDVPRITDAVLPRRSFLHDVTRVRISQHADVHETLFVELEGVAHWLRLRLL